MIHIDYPNGQKPSEEWISKAQALTDRLKAAKNKMERDKIIDDNTNVWGDTEIKNWLETYSHGKCWFSEARGLCFHWHVEHFRPKKGARDPDRDGYWWRAFDYLNYRLCGSVTNSKKGSYFPIKLGTNPAREPDDNCDDEACLLIDPTRKSDVDLITFSNGGMAVPFRNKGWDWERAEKSITRYKLNDHPPLRRAREQLWNACKQKVDELEILINERMDADRVGKFSPARQERIETLYREIKKLTLSSAEFSATARAFLLQDTRDWVNKLLG